MAEINGVLLTNIREISGFQVTSSVNVAGAILNFGGGATTTTTTAARNLSSIEVTLYGQAPGNAGYSFRNRRLVCATGKYGERVEPNPLYLNLAASEIFEDANCISSFTGLYEDTYYYVNALGTQVDAHILHYLADGRVELTQC
jgi:hypothetical protein